MGHAVKHGTLSSNTHALIGAGHMGGALLSGWISGRGRNKLEAQEILVVDPAPGAAARKALDMGVKFSTSLTKVTASGLKLCLLAIKPQIFEEVGPKIATALPKDVLIVSIMAGINLEQLGRVFGDRPIIRAMPNTPAAYGQGITAYVCGAGVSEAQEKLAARRLGAGGRVVKVDSEKQIDMVTAVSGSGPAYIFLLTETLQIAGEKLGLPTELAKDLARQTVIGSGVMLAKSEEDVSDLRKAVTSPRGTTDAALSVLMDSDGLPGLMRRAVNAAYERARSLGNK